MDRQVFEKRGCQREVCGLTCPWMMMAMMVSLYNINININDSIDTVTLTII